MCATFGGGRKRNWPLFSPTFGPGGFCGCEAGHYFHILFLSFFFYVFCISPTSGKLLWLKFCFPPYFGINRRNIFKKYFFYIILIFLQKKADFRMFFLLFMASIQSRSLDQPLFSLLRLLLFTHFGETTDLIFFTKKIIIKI